MRCVECGKEVETLQTVYSPNNIILAPCPECGKFADKYVEWDHVLLYIDMLLLKGKVFRHLLFNKPGVSRVMWRVTGVLVMIDAYLTLLALAQTGTQPHLIAHHGSGRMNYELRGELKALATYGGVLVFVLIRTVVFHATVRLVTRYIERLQDTRLVSTAITLSACTMFFPLCMLIWDYDLAVPKYLFPTASYIYNVIVLQVLLDTSFYRVMSYVLAGYAATSMINQLAYMAVYSAVTV